jgi:hypothetical protein
MNSKRNLTSANPQSDRLRVVERMHNSAMRCANPHCSKELLYLREGSLQMLELEPDSDDQYRQDDGAFAMKRQSSKFFWLCGECSKTHMVKRWTTSGLVLMLHNQKTAGNRPNLSELPKIQTIRSRSSIVPKEKAPMIHKNITCSS